MILFFSLRVFTIKNIIIGRIKIKYLCTGFDKDKIIIKNITIVINLIFILFSFLWLIISNIFKKIYNKEKEIIKKTLSLKYNSKKPKFNSPNSKKLKWYTPKKIKKI